MELDLKTLARTLGGHVSSGQVLAPGPGHSAADRSLSIKLSSTAPEGFLVHSFCGDDPIACRDYVKEKCGLTRPDKSNGHRTASISDDAIDRALRNAVAKQQAPKPKGVLTNAFDYTNENAELLYQVLKYDPKDFRQRRPDGNGGFIWSLDGVRRVLYHWPDLLKYSDATVFVCEGEKDADRVASLGHCATTVASGTWTDDCIQALAGRDCLILEDNDDIGRKKALEAALAMHGVANTIRIVRLPELRDHQDVSDWLDADEGNAAKLVDICFDAPLWQPAEKPADETKPSNEEQQELPPLPFINMANWDNEPVPEQEWAVLDRIPLGQTTLFTGEGGYGKSTVQLHLCAAHALGRGWLNTLPELGPAMFFEAEDGEKVIHRRLAAIATHYETTFEEMIRGGLHVISLFGRDAVLATPSRNGKIEATALYGQLLQAAGDIKPKMIGIASSANVFAGSEIDRTQTQQFVGLLNRVALLASGSVVLIAHPSLTGINTDTGLSGTTQWHNAVRARFYLKGIKVEAGEQPDNDLRELVFKKNQFGPMSASMVLRYQNGLFLPEGSMSGLDKIAREAKAEEIFLDLLKRFASEGRNLSHNVGSRTYAPTVFANETEAKKHQLRKAELEAAMNRLFEAKKIYVENYGRPSRPYSRIAIKD
jgi:RecA-family ATPase